MHRAHELFTPSSYHLMLSVFDFGADFVDALDAGLLSVWFNRLFDTILAGHYQDNSPWIIFPFVVFPLTLEVLFVSSLIL